MNREEIINKNFSSVYRGLDEKEVRQHLEKVNKIIESKDNEIKDLERLINDKEENINRFREVENSINEAVLLAQKAGEDTRKRADMYREEVIASAKKEREHIIQNAIDESKQVAYQTEDMKRQAKIFKTRFQMLVAAQLDLLQSDDWDHLLEFNKNYEHVAQDIEEKFNNNNQ